MDEQKEVLDTEQNHSGARTLTPAQDQFARVLGELLAAKWLAEHMHEDGAPSSPPSQAPRRSARPARGRIESQQASSPEFPG